MLKPFNEWSENTSTKKTVFATDKDGNIFKVCEWEQVSDSRMIYTAYNRNGTINARHEHNTTQKHFNKWILGGV
jgi:putative SOS response-associated peptidase YedK